MNKSFCIFLIVAFVAWTRAADAPPDPKVTAKWQEIAVQRFPQLGVAGSSLHTKFLDLYKQKKAYKGDVNDPKWQLLIHFFGNADWPLLLAVEASTGQSPLNKFNTSDEDFSLSWWATTTSDSPPVTLIELLSDRHRYLINREKATFQKIVISGFFGGRQDSRNVFVLKQGNQQIDVHYKALTLGAQRAELKLLYELPDDFSREITIHASVDQYSDSEALLLKLENVRLWEVPK